MVLASLTRPGVSILSGVFVVLGFAHAQEASKHTQPAKEPIQIVADLSDAPRRIFRAEIDLPVTAGSLTLTTPQWIPGTHMPAGPVAKIAGVVFTANGQTYHRPPRSYPKRTLCPGWQQAQPQRESSCNRFNEDKGILDVPFE